MNILIVTNHFFYHNNTNEKANLVLRRLWPLPSVKLYVEILMENISNLANESKTRSFSFANLSFSTTLSLLHVIPILILTIATLVILPQSLLLPYLAMTILFIASTLFSIMILTKSKKGTFFYLLNLMFLLGFWFKFSVQKLTNLSYREPIGGFILNSDAEIRVLWVIIFGIIGLFLAQLASSYFFNKLPSKIMSKSNADLPFKNAFLIIGMTLILASINLKYNILLFALKPSLILPFKGNVVYFLLLVRGTLFLFFYFCLKNLSQRMIFLGAIVATIASIGVLSRMIILVYFVVIFVYYLQNYDLWNLKKLVKNASFSIIIFSFFSFITVLFGTGAREYFMNTASLSRPDISHTINSIPETISKIFNLNEKIKIYKELALGRWIGMEGVMAVDAYPHKNFAFLWDALKEKSYHGNSFYTQISNPELYNKNLEKTVISTSVPGPIAFFYYSGSLMFVCFAIFATTLFFSGIEQLALKFFNQTHAVAIFISTIIVFDFFQFGISPLAFVRYCSFTFISIAIFYYFIGSKLQKGIHE